MTVRPLHVGRRSRGRTWWLTACMLLAGTLASPLLGDDAGSAQAVGDPKLPVLHSIGQIFAARETSARLEIHHVDTKVHIVYFDRLWNVSYAVTDDVTPQFMEVGGITTQLESGDVVRLQGRIRPADPLAFSSFTVTRLERKRPFNPLIIDGNLLEVLRLPERIVRTQALVERQFETDSTHFELHLIIEGRKVLGRFNLEEGAPVPQLAGHIVTLEGLLVPKRDLAPEFVAEMWIGDVDSVQSQGPLVEHPLFDRPITPLDQLAMTETGSTVRVQGVVFAISTGRDFAIDDQTALIRIGTAQSLHIASNQMVDVCGITVRTVDGWRLEKAFARAVPGASGSGPATAGSAPAAEQAAPGSLSIPTQPIPPEELPILTTFLQYWTVDASRKDWLHRIEMDLHVSYCDAGWSIMWAENSGRGTFIAVPRKDIDLRTGQIVRISGLAQPNKPLGLTADFTIREIEPYVPFNPIQIDGNLTDPALDARMVRLTGFVEAQSATDDTHTALELVVDGYHVKAWCKLSGTERLPDLVGRLVTVDGLLSPRGATGDDFAADLWIGRISTLQPLALIDRDPSFNITPIGIEDLAAVPEGRMVRIIGDVRSVVPGKSVTLKDGTGAITIKTVQTREIVRNGRLEVRGFPVQTGSDWTLARPLFRRPLVNESARESSSTTVRSTYRVIEDIVALSEDAAAQSQPVRMNAIVTWSHPSMPFLFVRDSSGGIEVMRPANEPYDSPPGAGTSVTIKGTTTVGSFSPTVKAESIEPGKGNILPDPNLISVEQAWTGSEEAQRIKLSGYVKSVAHEGAWTHLGVVSPGGKEFRATMPQHLSADQFRQATVRITGISQATTNADRQLQGITLWLNSHFDVEEIETARQDLFDREVSTISDLGRFSGQRGGRGLVRIHGTILATLPGDGVIVSDGSAGIVALTTTAKGLTPGDVLDIVGLLGTSGPRMVLRESTCRVIERNRATTPTKLSTRPLLNESLDSKLVTLEGVIVDRSSAGNRLSLSMSFEGEAYDATLDAPIAAAGGLPDHRQGATLRLTGVYRVTYTDEHHPGRFNVILRSAADIEVLQQPSWFTAGRAQALAGALALLTGAIFGWVHFLRRRVQHQTGQIRQQLIKEARLEDRQRNIIEKASDFIFMLDRAGSFTLFNPAGEAMTGYAPEDVSGLTLFNLIDENDGIGLRALLQTTVVGSEIQPFQTRFRRKDGTQIWVEVAARFLVEDERVTGLLCVARDITGRKAVEDELKRARDSAEANTKSKSAFLANMSHEIRTPMNGVIGMSNLLLDTPLNHDQRDFALTIRNSAEALLTVLNDILDFSKIEAGKLQFETLDFDLNEAVEDTLDLLAARAVSKRLELAALLPSTLPPRVRGDPGRLRQVLLNLIGNAIKFTEKGEISVTASLEEESAGTVVLRFEVKDTGIGIDPGEQERLFTPFSQADVSTTRKYGGTGLGLAICRQIVEQMHGSIGVRSVPGRGSTFWFTVQMDRAAASTTVPPPEVLRGMRVLGVDDNEANRTVLQHYLTSTGMRLDVASSGHEALSMLRGAVAAGDPFRLVLLDYQMPEMDGLALARAVHKDPRFQGLPMALLTSVDRRFEAPELATAGIRASTSKPIRQRDLIHTIQRALTPDTASNGFSASDSSPTSEPLPHLRVLIAEDNPINQRLTRLQLKKLGYEADVACNGHEVLEAFERVNYDVIFMDCQMPELDGYETTRRLAMHPRRGEVCIIAMTANAMQGDREKCLESGMDDYLSKPTRPDDLAAALRRAAGSTARTG